MIRVQTMKKNIGFTLVEILVSLVLFSIGMLGVALQFAQGISNTVNTEVHSSVMQIAMKTVEPLNVAVLQGNAELQTALNNLNTNNLTNALPTNNSDQNTFNVAISAVDNNPLAQVDLTTSNDFAAWMPPYTVVLTITYTGKNDQQLTFNTTHVLVP